jgi:hypothetical protein
MIYNNYVGNGLSYYPQSFNIYILYTSLVNNTQQSQYQLLLQTITDSVSILLFIVFIFYWRH